MSARGHGLKRRPVRTLGRFTPENGLLTDCQSVLPWVPSIVFSWHIAAMSKPKGPK
jgi:hypothetical protein